MKCPNCGSEILRGASYCRDCGAKADKQSIRAKMGEGRKSGKATGRVSQSTANSKASAAQTTATTAAGGVAQSTANTAAGGTAQSTANTTAGGTAQTTANTAAGGAARTTAKSPAGKSAKPAGDSRTKKSPGTGISPEKKELRYLVKTWSLFALAVATVLCLVMVPIAGAWNFYGFLYALLIFEAAGIYFLVAFSKKKGFRVTFLSIAMFALVALQIGLAITDAAGLQESGAWVALSKGAWAALAFLALGFLLIFFGGREQSPKKWSKFTKILPIGAMVLGLLGGTGGILAYAGIFDVSVASETGFDREFEAYYQAFEGEDIQYTDGIYYIGSQLLLTAQANVTFDEVEKLAANYGGEIVGYISTTCDYQISFPDGKTYEELKEILKELEENDKVEQASLTYVSEMTLDTVDYENDPWIDASDTSNTSGSDWDEKNPDGLNWWAEAVWLPSVWESDTEFATVKVGLIDSMFDTTNEDLDDVFALTWNQDGVDVSDLYTTAVEEDENRSTYQKIVDYFWGKEDLISEKFHGTHVAGLIAAEGGNNFGITGTSQNSELYGYATKTGESMVDWGDLFEWKYAISLMLEKGVQIINISMSFSGMTQDAAAGGTFGTEFIDTNSAYMEAFLQKYIDAGYQFLIVKAAGNDYGLDAKYDILGAIENEAVSKRIIIVGAADYKTTILGHTRYYAAEFSNTGSRVDVYAPGADILSDIPGNVTSTRDHTISGTSMATPIVSGIAALIWGVNPDLTAEDVRLILLGSVPLYMYTSDSIFDVPLVNADCSVDIAKSWNEEQEEKEESAMVTGIIYDATNLENQVDTTSITVYDEEGSVVMELDQEDIYYPDDSDGDGEYDISHELSSYTALLPSGSYGIEVAADGYDTLTKYFTVTAGDVVELDFDMSQTRLVVLVLDQTGSMDGTPLEETKTAAVEFVETVLNEGRTYISVVAFNTSATKLTDFTNDRQDIEDAINGIRANGGTNFEAALKEAYDIMDDMLAFKKIIVLMSDGMPNDGAVGDDLISYADTIKYDEIFLYTLGFFDTLTEADRAEAQALMEALATEGCHYEADDAENIVFFFGDIADQVSGGQYIYIRVACPVDVTVTYDGETLSSAEDNLCTRTTFGTLTFEEAEEEESGDDADGSGDGSADSSGGSGSVSTSSADSSEDGDAESAATVDNRTKILRLQAGTEYDIEINGTGTGTMDYTIAYMDEEGNYSDYRTFEDVAITADTVIRTKAAEEAATTTLRVDSDGDGSYEQYFRASANATANEIHYGYIVRTSVGSAASVLAWFAVVIGTRVWRKKRNAGQSILR